MQAFAGMQVGLSERSDEMNRLEETPTHMTETSELHNMVWTRNEAQKICGQGEQ